MHPAGHSADTFLGAAVVLGFLSIPKAAVDGGAVPAVLCGAFFAAVRGLPVLVRAMRRRHPRADR